MGKSYKEWNREFFEERMAYLDTQPKTRAPSGPSFRRVKEGVFISNETNPKLIRLGRREFMNGQWDRGVDISDAYEAEELEKMKLEAFPLEKETL